VELLHRRKREGSLRLLEGGRKESHRQELLPSRIISRAQALAELNPSRVESIMVPNRELANIGVTGTTVGAAWLVSVGVRMCLHEKVDVR
jgi:hypothetical protein